MSFKFDKVTFQKNKETKKQKSTAKRWAKIIASVLSMLLILVVLGIGVVHVMRSTPQENLASQHLRNGDTGAFPLRAMLVFEKNSQHSLLKTTNAHQEYAWCRTFEWDANSTLECSSAAHECNKQLNGAGTAEPIYVLMLHGVKCSGEIWLAVIRHWLAQRCCCNNATEGREIVFILPDLLGHGQSSWPEAKYTVELHVAALQRLLQSLFMQRSGVNATELHIVGHSLGAMLALELTASLLPTTFVRAASMTLMATPFFESRDQAERSASDHSFWFRNQWLATACCGYLVCRQNWLWQHAFRKKFARQFPQLPHAALVGGLQHTHRGIKSSIESVVLDHRALPAIEKVCNAHIPTMLIDSDADKLCLESQKQLRECFSKLAPRFSYEVTLKNAKHGFIVHNYAETTDHLRPFIETLAKSV